MGTPGTRRFKIEWIMNRVKSAESIKEPLDETKLSGAFSIFHGSTERTFQDILKDLENAGTIKRDLGMIFTPEMYAKERALEKQDLEADKILEDL